METKETGGGAEHEDERVGDWRDQRDGGMCRVGRREWEAGGDSEGLERPRRRGMCKAGRREWEARGDSEGLGRLERPKRPRKVHNR